MAYLRNRRWRGMKMINGKRITRSFDTKKEALLWELAPLVEVQEEKIDTISLLDFLSAYLDYAQQRFVQKTYQGKVRASKQAIKILGQDVMTHSITPAQAMSVLRPIARKSGDLANRFRKELAAAWAWGKKYYALPPVNPWLESEKFPADEKPRYVPPESDFWKVYETATEQEKTLLLFYLHTGARKSEGFRLVWDDVDFDRNQIRLGTRKTASGGMKYSLIPMTQELAHRLAEKRKTTLSKYVFTTTEGLPFVARNKLMSRLCREAGVTPFGFHAIRHLTATILAYSGLDLPTVQAILRHTNPNTTARYIKNLGINPDKVEAVFGGRKEEVQRAKVSNFA